MASNHLTALPAELLFRVTDMLSFNDKLVLSSTASLLREILAPELFHTLKADIKVEESLRVVCTLLEKYAESVRHLRFECHVGPKYNDYDDFSQPESDAEDEQQPLEGRKHMESLIAAWKMVEDLLNGKRSPRIEETTLCFYCAPEPAACDPDEVPELKHSKNPYWVQRFNQFVDAESVEDVKAAEKEDHWRFLLREIWDAIALNTTIRKLVVYNLIPKRATSFDLPEFKEFLAQLEEFDLKLLGMESWASVTALDGYMEFMRHLGNDFFNRLESVKKVRLAASEFGPLGLGDGRRGRHVPLPFHPECMPRLFHLELENCFIGRKFVFFMTRHASVLTSLKLIECRCTSPSMRGTVATAESRIYWADFFSAVRKLEDLVLSKLVILPRRVPITEDETYDVAFNVDEADEPEEVKSARDRLRENPRLRLFAYGSVTDDRYGTWYQDAVDVFVSFQNGHDQIEYDKLMNVVARNASQRVVTIGSVVKNS
ncbi:MAG: hypothetical protein Q9160_001107 [Pyrenula sp. 1 TL-2023]